MKFEIAPLPYQKDALEPYLSARTLELHYEKHHKGYLQKLREAIEDKPGADRSLEELICSSDGDVYNVAAQVWNHTFFWQSVRPGGGGKPEGELFTEIEKAFGNFDHFKSELAEAATGEFGSGWAWLVLDR